jgi:hypothetical protein
MKHNSTLRWGLAALALVCLAKSWNRHTCAFDNDRNTDIVWRNAATDTTAVWFMQNIRWFDSGTTITNKSTGYITGLPLTNWVIEATGDFDRDGNTDLVWHNPSNGQVVIWLLNGTTYRTNSVVNYLPAGWSVKGTGDFDGDGYTDIFVRCENPNYMGVWFMNGASYLSGALIDDPNPKPPPGYMVTSVGDFNNDGHPDVVIQNQTNQVLGIWYFNNTNYLGGNWVDVYATGWTNATTGPFNGIGNSDLVFRAANGQSAIWWLRNEKFVSGFFLPAMSSEWGIGGCGVETNVLELCATNVTSTNSFMLTWRLGNGLPVTIQRRLYDPSDTQQWSPLPNTPTNYYPMSITNTDLAVGQRYEYKVADEYLLTAINGTPVEQRGKVVLVVDNNITNSLYSDLEKFHTNLVGDGWTVVRTNVPPHDDTSWTNNTNGIAWIKNFITNTYYASPATNLPKAVILIGHVPVPHSGYLDPDYHGERCLPADMYYGDVDGVWTDTNLTQLCQLTFHCTNTLYGNQPDCSCNVCEPLRHDNLQGDGKWDQSGCPSSGANSKYELYVGRIDSKNLDAFQELAIPLSENDLLHRYFEKNDRYRKGGSQLTTQVMTESYFIQRDQYPGVVQQGIRLASRLFGYAPERLLSEDSFWPSNPSTWAVAAGNGQRHHIAGTPNYFHTVISSTTGSEHTFIAPGTEPMGGFYCLYGSCFMDHCYTNNLLRALIMAGTDNNLGAMWFRGELLQGYRNRLQFEQVALGETLGSGFLRTMNGITDNENTYQAWIGDPTLRLTISAAPTNLVATPNGSNVNLSWTASAEPSQYFVYRSTNALDGSFTRITTSAISSTNFTETNAPAGLKVYMVRGLNVKITASGSYTNLSQGIFANAN